MGSCLRFEDGTDGSTVAASTGVSSGIELIFSAINFKLKIIVKIMKNNIHRELYKLRIKRNCARIKKSTILLIKLTNITIKILTEHNSNSSKR